MFKFGPNRPAWVSPIYEWHINGYTRCDIITVYFKFVHNVSVF